VDDPADLDSAIEARPRTRRSPKTRLPNPEPEPAVFETAEPPQTPLIVGIGASAGGLNAFKAFFANMPADSGMAFVLVQHLDPHHKSILAELVSRQTAMAVIDAEQGVPVAANCVYIIPPDVTLTIRGGILQIERPAPPRQRRFPIDTFFSSLAEDQGENAVCIVLSGTGSDGSLGVKMIKEHGGLTLAQSEYDHLAMSGMPQNAAATGLVDRILPVEEMPAQLIEHQRHRTEVAGRSHGLGSHRDTAKYLAAITALLRSGLGHDFARYKENTLVRRIQRRMQVLRIDKVPAYIERLENEPLELGLLFQELLISVTQFFRDPLAFKALEATVLPTLLASKGDDDQVRIWVPGCATGEEVYSLAILVKEEMDRRRITPNVQIFGTDIDDSGVTIARAGCYSKTIDGLSPERIKRWFVEDGDQYRVVKQIREMCVFSTHSVVKDPPFSKLDLVSCRNLLIYLNPDLQERVVRTFHYALRQDGILFLGPSEGVTRSAQLFTAIDAKHRLFRRRDTAVATRLGDFRSAEPARPQPARSPPRAATQAEDLIDKGARNVLEKHSPAYLVINRQHEIVRFSGGQTGRYLEPTAGAPTLSLFGILRKSLRPIVRTAVEKAFASRQAVVNERVNIKIDGHSRAVTVIVEPIADDGPSATLCVVAFQDLGSIAERRKAKGAVEPQDANVQALEDELFRTKEHLQAAIDDAEAANQETGSSAEEYQSVNEELQASNEELETAKEEMQSINEELQTVNAELSSKNDLLTRLNSDMQNLLESTQIATVFLDNQMRIKGFTPAITNVFHLRDTDQGRPITEIVTRLAYDELQADVETVLRKLTVIEREVQIAEGGTAFIMHIRPYHTVDRVVDGVVMTFVDITERRRIEEILRECAAIVEFAQDALIGVSLDGNVRSWNPGAERLFGYPASEAEGRPVSFLIVSDRPDQQTNLIAQALNGEVAGSIETVQRRQDGTIVDVELTVVPIRSTRGVVTALAATARDISERKHAETHRTLLLHELSHRVKNALASVQSLAMETLRTTPTPEAFREAFVARLIALSNTHDLLTQGEWQGASLGDVLEAELAPYLGPGQTRWTASGANIQLQPKMALALGMAFHELATNAAKYGALSVATGHIDVSWRNEKSESGRRLHLSWIESGGPTVEKPLRKGFGSRLIADGLAFELDGDASVEYDPAGVRSTVDVPLASMEVA
jgi:two-component system, chemotaxis family, CheB/CheR fusion protein